jgi:hypothetical protein
MHRKPAAIAAIGVAVALAAGGCGGSGGSSATAKPPVGTVATLLAANQSTTAQKSAKLSLVENISVAGHQISVHATGVTDFATHALDFTMGIAGQQLEMRELGGELYAKLPASLAGHVPGNKPWLAINLNSLTKSATGSTLSQLQSTSQSDPSNLLAYLNGISATGAHRVGTATTRGVPTTEYAVNVDLAKALAKAPAAARKGLRAGIKSLGTSTIPMKVWVDHSQLVRQLSFAIKAPAATATQGSSTAVTMTMQLFDFGTPVHVTAPPKSQQYNVTNTLTRGGTARATTA